jgi:hypothetical protein
VQRWFPPARRAEQRDQVAGAQLKDGHRSRLPAAFRDVARARCPQVDAGARAAIGQSLAWQWAAEPYAPLRTITGIDWTPVQVDVHHKRARPGRTA